MPVSLMLVLRPLTSAAALKKRPRWAASLLLVCTGSVLLSVLLSTHLVEQVLAFLPSGATGSDKDLAASDLAREMLLRSAFLPFRIVLGCTAFALLLSALCRSVTSMVQFRFAHIFSAVVAAELILLAGKALGAFALIAGWELPPWIVPSVLLGGQGELTDLALFNHLNIITLWYAATLGCAIHILCEFRWAKAAIVTILAVTSWVAFDVAVLGAVRTAYGLLR